MKIQPLSDRLLLKRIPTQEKIGLLHIPDAAKQKSERARVLAVGPGRRTSTGALVPMSCKKGDVVVLSKWPGNEIKLGEDECLLVSEEEILGIESES